jgi:biofilm PGA synthesis lipoprotein PgaB
LRRRACHAARLGLVLACLPALAAAAALPPIHPKARGSATGILMWHDIVPGKKLVWFDTTVAELKAQFAEIRRLGLTPISLERLAAHLERGEAVPKKAVVLTFDDNNLGLSQHVFPLLKRYRWPAVFFVHTGYVGVTTGKPHNTWDQLREMERSGLVKAYPHTDTHPEDMRKLTDARIARELTRSRQKMERELGGPRVYFTYPDGHFDARVAAGVFKAGYRLAITEDRGLAEASPNLMMVHRYSMHRRPGEVLKALGGGR